ncbi:venom carboxylesterase-6 isoform X1 [Nasonia vitripennis]|uniref:Carboxylic ester hydrolase n=2 Tax=Nasonia vitripennis TaxID=7425 RepID=A0A7M7G1V6_NASVI|nr:venom carboxylesterase-6 isoform X1 [Nasonia vitripennis]
MRKLSRVTRSLTPDIAGSTRISPAQQELILQTMRGFLYLLLGTFLLADSALAYKPLAHIKNGTLEGTVMKSRKGREFYGFRGIPYALPPISELRFEPPKPAAAWAGVRSAKEDANICTQRNIYTHQEEIVGIEDCLYLNVHTPKLPGRNEANYGAYPVMVWFHGGGWVTGAGHSEFYGPKFLLDHDVILVTVNYRLGPLGFLSTEDLVTPGNNGMKDQAQAIRWVHENIADFGGDPNRVTLFGESAGGVAVHYHMTSPLSRGLFQRGISQSGTALCPWALTRPGLARKKAQRVAELLGCPKDDSRKLVDCLRTKEAVDIIGTDRAFQVFDYCPMIPFRPVIEPDHPGAFLKEDPAISLKNGRLSDITWMTGITSHEGTLRVPGLYGLNNGELIKRLDKDFENLAPTTLLFEDTCPQQNYKNVSKAIREFYFGDKPLDKSTKYEVINMYSDAWFNYAADEAVRDHLKLFSSPIYYYYFSYRGSASFSRIFGDPTEDYGVSHADELQYLFPVGEQLFQDIPLSKEDNRIIDIVTALWYNFAKSGNPTPEITPDTPTKWKPVHTPALEYLNIGNSKDIHMSKNLFPERLKFWSDLMPSIRDIDGVTYQYKPIRDEL